jgi:hypothetical protein
MPGDGRLLIFEPLLPEGSEVSVAPALDVLILVVFGGRLRTQAELGGLLDSAGFRLHRVAPAPPLALVEAIAR